MIGDQANRLPRWVQHVLFWGILSLMTRNQFVRMYAPGTNPTPNPAGFWLLWPAHLLFAMGAFYLIGYYLIPTFWNRRGGVQFILLFVLYWQLSYLQMKGLFEVVVSYFPPAPAYVIGKLAKIEAIPWYSCFTDAETFFNNWAFNFSYVIIPLLIKARRDETSRAERMLALEQEKMNMELSFLKAQINPHFLFNAFNNLYTLILKGDQQAGLILADLSAVMRYTLYRTGEQYVPLSNELKFLANYVRLESIRFPKTKVITASITGDSSNWLIPPMIIVTFVENAVKHGLNKSIGHAWMDYVINVDDKHGLFHMKIKNSRGQGGRSTTEGGIGIANVRKRLDLLMKDRYNLILDDRPDAFTVTLTLPLKRIGVSAAIYEVATVPDLQNTQPTNLQETTQHDSLSDR